MYTYSLITLILGGAFLLFIGWLISYFVQKRNKTDYKSKFEGLESDYLSLSKSAKKEERKHIQIVNDRDHWKEESTQLQRQYERLKEEHIQLKSQHGGEYSALQQKYEASKSNVQNLTHTNESLKKEFNKLKERYSKSNKDQKQWSSQVVAAEKEMEQYKVKWARSQKETNDLTKKLEEQTEKIDRFTEVNKALRRANTQNKKLSSDIEYWEKKHYDTHHELASLTKEFHSLRVASSEVTDLRKGDQIVIENMKKQLEEYKHRYIDVNHKYRELISENN